MGTLLRHYWWPIAATVELTKNPVKAVTILGEHLTLYKDKSGELGLVGQRCAHRRFDLQFGIPEDCGLRCSYHGWLFDAEGQCIEMPAEPADSTFKDRVRIPSYPVQELGGLIFAYLGEQPAPLLPRWDLFTMENSIRGIAAVEVPCNYLQCMENSADPVHVEWLHGHLFKYVLERQADAAGVSREQMSKVADGFMRHHEKIAFERHPFGMVKRRQLTGDTDETPDWKYGHLLVFPDKVRLGGASASASFQIRVPMDDERTWHICYDVFKPEGVELPKQDVIPLYESPITDEEGEYILDYVLSQDMVGWWSQGKITDRTEEKLGESDKGLILFRRMLKEQLKIVEDGGTPMNVFTDPLENEYLDLNLYQDAAKVGSGRITAGTNLRRNYQRYSPDIEALEELFSKASALR
jgi:5,5'-dehydrodivanillate O-demethylase